MVWGMWPIMGTSKFQLYKQFGFLDLTTNFLFQLQIMNFSKSLQLSFQDCQFHYQSLDANVTRGQFNEHFKKMITHVLPNLVHVITFFKVLNKQEPQSPSRLERINCLFIRHPWIKFKNMCVHGLFYRPSLHQKNCSENFKNIRCIYLSYVGEVNPYMYNQKQRKKEKKANNKFMMTL